MESDRPFEQRPEAGQEPLTPPPSDVAVAYLDEAAAVGRRRDVYVDRRLSARLHVANAIVFFAFFSLAMFASVPSRSTSIMLVLVPVLVWSRLQTELRESRGAQMRMTGQARAWYLAAFVVILGAFLTLTWLRISGQISVSPMLLIPGVLAGIVFGIFAFRDARRSVRQEHERPPRPPFSFGERMMTLAIGVGLGALAAASAAWGEIPVVASALFLVAVLGMLLWFLTAQVSGSVPAPGAVWRAPQWCVFAGAAGLLAVVAASPAFGVVVPGAIGFAIGTVIIAAFVVTAFVGGRHEE
ncbi:hypothetical protein GCM10025768_12160 [Microbacterium pseudoresistens]|uniref:Small-conductance mechanosensitive channel n=1 Tax=Microbacterium pseudoresistens TaxID=640634 RepID=A0A7Y9JPX8_9MICO|nr:hypothetical protein [Microbacterium pseudoresistens]NYD55119.1 small-conductance mechanosensitive channel [Microbacterium pseudoresistens]